MRRYSSIALAILMATSVAACGDNVQDEMAESAVSEAMIPGAVDTVTAAAASDQLVDAMLTDWAIDLDPDTIASGQITFRVRNSGDVVHSFEVEGQDQEWQVEDIGPRLERTLTMDLAPGTYTVYCPIEDDHGKHAEMGMRTTFVVR